jgi:putative ABC transport system permease protein
MVAGRTFSEPPRRGVVEAIVDNTVARRFFPTGTPLGATIRLSNLSATIVGVVQQARLYDVHADGRPQVLFRVSEEFGFRPLFFVMRTTRDPDTLLPDVQSVVHQLDPRVPVGDPRSMDDIVDQSLSSQAIGASLLGAFAIGALLLATMGLFGVVSESVTRRHHELAVRLALGADHPSVLRMVLKEGMLLVMIGLMIGTPGIYMSSGAIRGLLLGVAPLDPIALLAASSGLLLTTLAACYMPARRALTIDPASLFRQ